MPATQALVSSKKAVAQHLFNKKVVAVHARTHPRHVAATARPSPHHSAHASPLPMPPASLPSPPLAYNWVSTEPLMRLPFFPPPPPPFTILPHRAQGGPKRRATLGRQRRRAPLAVTADRSFSPPTKRVKSYSSLPSSESPRTPLIAVFVRRKSPPFPSSPNSAEGAATAAIASPVRSSSIP